MRLNFTSYIKKYSLFIVLLIAFLLRFWNLGSTPPSLYWDEVSQAYNSYSLLKTGYDEHKEFFPVARFQAFGDYKAPTYIYLDILPILLFGQTEFAVRLPSALLGSLTVLLTYLLSREIFFSNRRKQFISIVASFMLAISPWHVQLSRVAYEANVATVFTVGGMFLFLLGVRKNSNYLLLSILSFVVGFYSFNAHRIFIPLLASLLIVTYRRFLRENVKKAVLFASIGMLCLLPFISYLKSPESRLRFKEVNIFSDISVIEESNKLINQDGNSMTSKVLHNRRVLYGISYIKHYFDFFNPAYLFFKGDVNPRFSTLDTGELYLYTFPFIILGMLAVWREKKKTAIFLFGWFLLSPVAAATARETPHALRSETFIPVYEIFIGFGFVWFYGTIQKLKKIVPTIVCLIVFLIVFYLLQFLHSYYIHMPVLYSQDWQYGYREAIDEVEKIKNNYDKIVFSDAYGRAYIYALWYGKYPPQYYWQTGMVTKDIFGFYNVQSFGKYVFQKPNTYIPSEGEKVLYVGPQVELPYGLRTIDQINFLDGSSAFVIADNK